MPALPWTTARNTRPPAWEIIVMAPLFELQERREVAPFFLATR